MVCDPKYSTTANNLGRFARQVQATILQTWQYWEQYFHAWRSFQFDEATHTINGYIQKVKQVAALLDYGEPQILELFKNTLPSRLYYMLCQINDFREAVEMAKRQLTKE